MKCSCVHLKPLYCEKEMSEDVRNCPKLTLVPLPLKSKAVHPYNRVKNRLYGRIMVNNLRRSLSQALRPRDDFEDLPGQPESSQIDQPQVCAGSRR